jgi:flavin reductase (DIM6/NTAB) family NADH-FMN oxidoreductase RutF
MTKFREQTTMGAGSPEKNVEALSEAVRETMRLWASGVTVVTTVAGGRRAGMTVSAFTSLSLDPPLVLVALHRDTEVARLIRRSRLFGISILGEEGQGISQQFAGLTPLPEGADRFHGCSTVTRVTGVPLLSEAIAWLDCRVIRLRQMATHLAVVGEVLATGRKDDPVRPLVYHNRGYARLA